MHKLLQMKHETYTITCKLVQFVQDWILKGPSVNGRKLLVLIVCFEVGGGLEIFALPALVPPQNLFQRVHPTTLFRVVHLKKEVKRRNPQPVLLIHQRISSI